MNHPQDHQDRPTPMRRRFGLLATMLLALLSSFALAQDAEANKEAIRNLYEALSGQPKTEELLRRHISSEALIEHVLSTEAAFPEYRLTVDEMIAEGDLVAVRLTAEGTHEGEFAGIAPTGTSISIPAIAMYRVQDGMVTDFWIQIDQAALMQQLSAPEGGGDASVGPAHTIRGTVRNWPGGSATVQLVVTDSTGRNIVNELGPSGIISDDGSLELDLPATLGSEFLTSSNLICNGAFDGAMTPSSWGQYFMELAVLQDGAVTGGLLLGTSPDPDSIWSPETRSVGVFRAYVDRVASVHGTCMQSDSITEFDADLEQGWNHVVMEVEAGADGGPLRTRVTAPESIPAEVEWYFFEMPSTP